MGFQGSACITRGLSALRFAATLPKAHFDWECHQRRRYALCPSNEIAYAL